MGAASLRLAAGLATAALAVCVVAASSARGFPQRSASGIALQVSPSGDDANPGTTERPLRTVQQALDLAEPGTIITLAPGVYDAAATRRPGRSDAPVTIRGGETGRDPGGRFRTVIRGSRVVLQINHSYYHVEGLTIDGQPSIGRERFPSRLPEARAFKDSVQAAAANSKLVYVGYAPDSRDITGVVLDNLFLHGAGGECVRLRNDAFGNEISNSVIEWCGVAASGDDLTRYRYHNGEGVYIGTSPKSTTQPMFDRDTSHDNVVRDSVIRTFGSECLDVKENAHHNRMLRVECVGNDEPQSFGGSNVELRGDHNTIEASVIGDSRGANLKIASDDPRYDKGGNAILRNRFLAADGPHIAFKSAHPLGPSCGNVFASTRVVDGPPLPGVSSSCAAGRE